MKAKLLFLYLVVLMAVPSLSQTNEKDPDYCSRLLHESLLSHRSIVGPDTDRMGEGRAAGSPDFAAEEKWLYNLNTSSVYRKVATVTYHPDSAAGMFTLQMGAGQPLYTGNSLQTLTHRMNSASQTMPGETVYVKLIAPPDHAEALQHSLKMQQSVIGDGVSVMPISTNALERESLDLLFTYPVKEIKESPSSMISAEENVGWFQKTLNVIVKTKEGLKSIQLTIIARTAEVLSNIVDVIQNVLKQQTGPETRSVTEIVAAARVKAKRDHGHVADIDYMVRAEVPHSFMVKLDILGFIRG